MCLFAVLSSTSAFAAAGWLGAGVINVNGTWYYADQHGSTSWASGSFDGFNLGSIFSLELGGQVQLWDENNADWGSGTAKMCYKIDNGEYQFITLYYYKFLGNNNFFQSGGEPMVATKIDLSELEDGAHILYVYFDDYDSKKTTPIYTANFTKVTATVTNVDAFYDWTGSVIHPVPVVTVDDTQLTSSAYDVTYSDGCTNVGDYKVTITGKGDYTGSIVKNFSILVPTGYYLVGDMNNWELKSTYQLTANTVTPGEYYINNVELSSGQGFKVVRTNDGKTKDVYYPDGTDNNYKPGAGKFFVYFRPDGQGGNSWHYGCIYATTTASVDVNLAGTGYGTYYNSTCEVTLPSGVVAYIVTDATPTYEKIADGDGDGTDVKTTVPAGVAVLLYSASSSVALGLSTTITDSRTFNYNKLHGSDTETTTTGGVKYYKLTYGSIEGHESYFGWFYGADDGASFTSPAHKAWLALPNSASRGFLDLPDGDTTGIASIENKQQGTDNVWYDLNGRRIKAPTTKGIYVKDGRKLVIK